jgi:acyl-CoA thioester hydrolase
MFPTFVLTHRVQFSETDAAGVVHFSNYGRWLEEVEHAYFRACGLSVQMRHGRREIGWPRVAVACQYAAPARFEDEVELHFRIQTLGSRSLTYRVQFVIGGRPIATGEVTSVCCRLGPGGMKAITIPPAIRRKLTRGPTGG